MYLILVLLYGLLIGSFLNVCIYRIPQKQSIITTPSHCYSCGNRIIWYDLVPVFSYLFLGGRCRNCKAKLSIQYPLVELLNAVAYMMTYYCFGVNLHSVLLMLIASVLIVISFIDFEHKIIPDRLIISLFVLGLAVMFFASSLTWLEVVIGFFCISIPLLLIAIITNGGIGGGDIKLMAVSGIFLGWKLNILSFFFGSILGAIISIILMVSGAKKRKDEIPFGPSLAVGIFVAALYGDKIISWYLETFLHI